MIMAALRKTESNDNYDAIYRYPSGKVGLGAYQITRTDWARWTRAAGIAGADWRSPKAQDRVAAMAVSSMLNRYGSAELVSLAWYGGSNIADEVARTRTPIDDIPFTDSLQYVNRMRTSLAAVPHIADVGLPDMPTSQRSSWLMPVAGDNTWSDTFRMQRSASQIASGKSAVHEGIDIMAAKGTPIVAPVAGTVVSAGWNNKGGWTTKIRGDDGIDYYFAHMDQQALVTKGQRVGQGYHLGFVGNSGNASNTSPHLHFTMHRSSDRSLLNPSAWLDGGGTASGQYRSYEPADNEVTQQGPGLGFMDEFINKEADQIAGGQRVDYRTIGDLPEGAQPDVSQITLSSDPWEASDGS
jgi:hypothetical protein